MKKYSKILFVAVLLFAAVLITGCGGSKEKESNLKDAAGTYEGIYGKFVGDEEHITDEEFSLVLKEDGTGKHNRDGGSFDVEWSLDGENFTMKDKFGGLTIDYTGTLKDGKLQIYNGDPTNAFTYEYNYEKK